MYLYDFNSLQLRSKGETISQPKNGNDNKKTQPKNVVSGQKGNNTNKKSNTSKSNNTASKQVDNAKNKPNAKSKSMAQNSGKKDDTTAVKEVSLAEDLKTDAGAASDESWEKDFDLSDQ